MIRAAHIGVGIIGKEGTQAVNNADYAIGQFRFLTRMILVYGHRFYRGITLASLLIFYKNVLFTLIQYLYTFVCGLSGTRNQSYIAILWYNTLLTAFGPLLLAIMDRDLTDVNYLRFPQLHREGMDHRHFSVKRFLVYLMKALVEAFVIFFVLFFGMYTMDMPSGTVDVWIFGMIAVTVNIVVVNISASIEQSVMYGVTVVIFWLQLVCWVALVLSNSYSLELYSNYYHAFTLVFENPICILVMILAVVIALLPTMIVKAIARECYPTLSQFIQDVQVRGANPEKMKTALENMAKQRSVELELKTITDMPRTPRIPELMSSSIENYGGEEGKERKERSPVEKKDGEIKMECDDEEEKEYRDYGNDDDDDDDDDEMMGGLISSMQLPPSYPTHPSSNTNTNTLSPSSLSPSSTTTGKIEDPIPTYMLWKNATAQASIRSMAGLRALTLCQRLHGPAYDCQSINEQTQNELITKINSHAWRQARPDMMDTLKSSLLKVNDAIHQLSDTIGNENKNLVTLLSGKYSLHMVKESVEEEEEEQDEQETQEKQEKQEKQREIKEQTNDDKEEGNHADDEIQIDGEEEEEIPCDRNEEKEV